MEIDFLITCLQIIFIVVTILAILGIVIRCLEKHIFNIKSLMPRLTRDSRKKKSENGNIFLAIFGAVALVGLLGASVMTFMKGPLATSVRLTKMNTAENQMSIGAQVAVMATASQTVYPVRTSWTNNGVLLR